MREHSFLSASSAKKWLNCPMSATLESQMPDKSSAWAVEGTTAHTLAELMLKKNLCLINNKVYETETEKLEIDKNMIQHCKAYTDFVLSEANKYDNPDIWIEHKVDYSNYVPGGYGTADTIIASDDTLTIVDLKYGKNVKVAAENNPQLRLYAIGALNDFDMLYAISKIQTIIFQPRMDNISVEKLSYENLINWADKSVKEPAQLAAEGKGECVPGEYCDTNFCKARAICKAYATQHQNLIDKSENYLTLSSDDLAKIILAKSRIESWLEEVTKYATQNAMRGIQYPGLKLVESKVNRKYSNENEVINILKNNGYEDKDIFVSKLKSITDLKKMLGVFKFSSLISDYVVQPQGLPTLVPIKDKRPELQFRSSAQDDFKGIIESN